MVPQPIGTKKVPVTAAKKHAVAPAKKAPITTTKVVQPTKKKPVPPPYKPTPATPQKKPVTTLAQKKPLPTPAKPAAPQQQSWLTRGISAASSGIGNAAGAVVTAAGNGVAGAGKGAGSSYVLHPSTSRHFPDTNALCQDCKLISYLGRYGPRVRQLAQRHNRCEWKSSTDQDESPRTKYKWHGCHGELIV